MNLRAVASERVGAHPAGRCGWVAVAPPFFRQAGNGRANPAPAMPGVLACVSHWSRIGWPETSLVDEPGPATQRAMQAIERYVAQHPAAADSAEGIAQWWLPAMGIDASMDEVTQALEILVDRGVLERAPLPGGQAIYRAAPHPSTP